jgi:MFS family permease
VTDTETAPATPATPAVEETPTTQWNKIQAMAFARAFGMLGTELTLFSMIFREKDLGPTLVAAVFIAVGLPSILISPWAGTIADRFSTRVVIPIFSLIAGAAIFAQTQMQPTWIMLTLLVISSSCGVIIAPTWGKLTRVLAAEADYSRASGVIQSYFALAMLLGPFIAGYMVSTVGFFWTFATDAFFTTAMAAVPFLLRVNHKPEAPKDGEKLKVSGGYVHLFGTPLLRALSIMVFAVVLALSVISVGDVFLVTQKLHANALIYGLVSAGFAMGVLTGSLVASKLKLSTKTELKLLGVGFAVFSLAGVAVGLAPNYWFVMVIWFIGGVGNAAVNTYGIGIMTRSIPMEIQGRTFAAFNGIISLAGIASQAAAGIILAFIDVRVLFAVAGSLAFLAFATLFPVVVRMQRNELAAA